MSRAKGPSILIGLAPLERPYFLQLLTLWYNPQIVKKDLTGERFGRLLVIQREENKDRRRRWLCQCDCGKTTIVNTKSLTSGNTSSCGCLHKELAREKATIHGRARTFEYQIWANIIQRCTNPKNTHYINYGGRGITICEQWKNSFENFFADVGSCPANGMMLDRSDNNGNYEPGNVRWATRQQQMRNRRNNRIVEFHGQRKTLIEWAEDTQIPYDTLRSRLTTYGWSIERALTTKVDKK